MTIALEPRQREALARTLRKSYLEIFPTPTIESRLDVLSHRSYIAVTCSPTLGVDATLAICERLAGRGFRVVPHVAARMVRDKSHLRAIVRHLDATDIVSLFVPGGDAARPAGEYTSSLELLRDLADIGHRFEEIGVAAHPEKHPFISDDALLEVLLEKQRHAHYLVTQMCFDAGAIARWSTAIRRSGVTLPVWLGLPGAVQRSTLLATSLRIGVGDSLRYLRRQGRRTARLVAAGDYSPDGLLCELADTIADPVADIRGCHIFCFNQVRRSVQWRESFLDRLESQH